jgi:Xaa-Pro aminopeptidase
VSRRASRLAAELPELEVDFLLISAPVNVSYLTGYTGSNGIALIGARELECDWFYTDFRYATQSAEQVDDYFQREIIASGGLLAPLAETLTSTQGSSDRRLGFDEEHLSVKQHGHLAELLGEEWELVECAGAVERLRAVKDPGEIARITAAAELVDEILRWISEQGLIGRTERELAVALEHQMRILGAQGPSFPSIVASGTHGALPHATPRDVQIQPGQLVTIDLGALLDGYCSDCTRTFATGELPAEQREIYELVLRAQLTGLQAVEPGISGQDVDSAAREVIAQGGHAEHFGHGLGHGVGMEVHEGPRLSQTASEQVLRAGNVVTVEPGIYIPGRFGLRIEDLVLVTDDGSQILSSFPKELTVLD